MKTLFLRSLWIVLILPVSCVTQEKRIVRIEIQREETLLSRDIPQIDSGCYGDLLLKKDLLFMETLCNEYIFYGLETHGDQPGIAFGKTGPGPEEYFLPLFMNTRHDSLLTIFDVNTCYKREYSVQDNPQGIVNSSIQLPLFLRGSQETYLTQENILYGIQGNGAGLFFKCNLTTGEKPVWFNHPGYDDLKADIKQSALSNKLWIHEGKNRIAIAMKFYNRLHLFDLDGNEVKTIYFGKDTGPGFDQQLSMVNYETSIVCFTDLYGTEDKLYALWKGATMNSEDKPVLFELDWEGHLLHTYLLDRNITSIAVDPKKNQIYGTAKNENDLLTIVRY